MSKNSYLCVVLDSKRNNSVFLFWGDFIAQFLGLAVQVAPFEQKRRSSVGQKILPQRYKQNSSAIVIANIFVWLSVVAVIAVLVLILS